MNWFERFLSWADRRHLVSVRAFSLYMTLWLTHDSYTWASEFAYLPGVDHVAKAAIIAAVTAPVSVLQGYVFKWYMEAKK